MPCSDVTEIIRVMVDDCDRLANYQFSKRTCGQGVGAESLLIEQLGERSVEELLAMDAESFLTEHPIEDELEEFLSLKHLFGVQSALEVLTGHEPGGPADPCAAAEIAFEDGHVVITAQIDVDLMTEKIQSCGGCKKCGTKRKVVFN
jgi:hypothetical protein